MIPIFLLRRFVYLFLLAGVCLLLVGCNIESNENGIVASSREVLNIAQPTETTIPSPATETLPALTLDAETPTLEEVVRATETIVPTVTVTAASTPTPSLTPALVPLATPVFIQCQAPSTLPGKAFPTQIDMAGSHNQRVVISYPYLYLAAEHYIGMFDISAPDKPLFLGFWEFPYWSNISTLQVNSGVIYFTSGSTLVILNLSPECLFETITTIDVPLQVFRLETQGNRLYVGGFSTVTGRDQVVIYSIDKPDQPQKVGVVDLGSVPATWSVFEEMLFYLGARLTATNLSNPAAPEPHDIEVSLDSEILKYSPSKLFEDRLYLLWEGRYLTIISNLQDEVPVVKRDSQQRIISGNLANFVFQVSENYIFLGDSSCDISCSSVVIVLNSEDGQELFAYGLPDNHYPIRSYYEISPDIIFAFSDEFLLVIDISDTANPKIIVEVPLTT